MLNTRLLLRLGNFLILVGIVAIVTVVFVSENHKKRMNACADNIFQLGLRLMMYAHEHDGEYPPLSILFGGNELWPANEAEGTAPFANYIPDPSLVVSPVHPARKVLTEKGATGIGSNSYWYLGFALSSEQEGLAYSELIRENRIVSLDMPKSYAGEPRPTVFLADDTHIIAPIRERAGHAYSSSTLQHFAAEKLELSLVEAPSESIGHNGFPILIERPSIHTDGGHILWADLTVEFIPYPGKFPMTEKFITALEELDPAEPPLD